MKFPSLTSSTVRNQLWILCVCALILLAPTGAFADGIDEMFNPISTGSSRTKQVLITLIDLGYLAIILLTAWKLASEEGKKWQIAMGGFLGLIILGGIHAYALTKMTTGT